MSNMRFFLLVVFWLFHATSLLADTPKLRVGFVGALSGPASAYGIAAKNGMQMAIESLPPKTIEVIYEDDQYTTSKTVAAFKKLTEVNKVDLVIGMASTPSNAVAPLAEKAKIPFITWANDPKVGEGRSYVILSEQSAHSEGKIIAAEVMKRRYKNIATIFATGDYQQAAIGGLLDRIDKELVVLEEEVLADEKNFTPFLLKARQKNVQAIGMCLHPGQFGTLAKQAKKLGLNVSFFGCNMLQDSSEFKISEGALKHAWYVAIDVDDDFKRAYVERFKNDSVMPGAAIFYELTQLLAEELGKKGSLSNSQAILDLLLASEKRKGVVGEYTVKREDGVQFLDIPLSVKTVNG